MMVGNTWKAKLKPKLEVFLPISPKMNDEPAKEKSRKRVTPAPALARAARPASKRKTRKANANCSPTPQARVLRRMERRAVENAKARASMEARPMMPTSLYIVSSCEL